MSFLDWSDASHWNAGRAEPCHWCGAGCWTLDDLRRVAHKSCAEARLPAAAAAPPRRPLAPVPARRMLAQIAAEATS